MSEARRNIAHVACTLRGNDRCRKLGPGPPPLRAGATGTWRGSSQPHGKAQPANKQPGWISCVVVGAASHMEKAQPAKT